MRLAGSRRDFRSESKPSLREQIELAKWHIDRYDRLRASTATRASAVLSAGAILSAGNAVVLAQLLGNAERLGADPAKRWHSWKRLVDCPGGHQGDGCPCQPETH